MDRVNDIKCHSTKMHRLLICYDRTAVVVFSINKNCAIQTLPLKEKMDERGRALACEWIGPECREFIVGFELGKIEVFRAESNVMRNVRVIDFKPVTIKSLDLCVVQRPKAHYYLIIVVTRDMNGAELER